MATDSDNRPSLADVQKALKAVWPLFAGLEGCLYMNADSYGGIEFHICSGSNTALGVIADCLLEPHVSISADPAATTTRYQVKGRFGAACVRVCFSEDEWPKTALAQAAERVRDAIASGTRPDPEDLDEFPKCGRCGGVGGDRAGTCPAECAYGRVLPPESVKVEA
jgi:hypothetical protein